MTEMPKTTYVGSSRYLCTIFEEMRECLKSVNFSYFGSLIEEAQMLANRMESALEDNKSIIILGEEIHKLKKARKAIKKEVQELIDKRDSHGQ